MNTRSKTGWWLLTAAAMAIVPLAPALAQPANDGCPSAIAISGYGSTAFDNTGGTTDGVDNATCLFFGSQSVYNDVWFCWTAPATALVQAGLCGASYDTKLAVYDGCTCPEGSGIVACNDDSCGLQSQLTFNAIAGHQYLVRVGAYSATGFGTGSLTLAAAPLPGTVGGPLVNPANGHTYYLLIASTWTAAETNAVALGGHLATVRNADENEWIRANLANFGGVDRRVWIGLSDVTSEGTFVWTSGEPVGYTNWNGGEPNNSGGVEDYVELFGSNGQWNDNSNNPPYAEYGVVEIIPAPSCPADYDQNGHVEPADIAAFVNAWFGSIQNGTLAGDFDHNGVVEPADIAGFVNAWFSALTNGC